MNSFSDSKEEAAASQEVRSSLGWTSRKGPVEKLGTR